MTTLYHNKFSYDGVDREVTITHDTWTPPPPEFQYGLEAPEGWFDSLLRAPLSGQDIAIATIGFYWWRGKVAFLAADCGTGKTFMASAAAYMQGMPSVLVLCPGHLCEKWKREIESAVPAARVAIARRISDLADVEGKWIIVSKETAKLGPTKRIPRRWPLAKYVKSKLRFDCLIADEAHEYRGDSQQGKALGTLAGCAKKILVLTGTLTGGDPEDLRKLLFRVCPAPLVADGFTWKDSKKFRKAFGCERVRTIVHSGKLPNGRPWSKERVTRRRCPGISPALVQRYIAPRGTFCKLSDIADGMPALIERETPVIADVVRNQYQRWFNDRVRSRPSPVELWLAISRLQRDLDRHDPWSTKEQVLSQLITDQIAAGRKCWVFLNQTGPNGLAKQLAATMPGRCAWLDAKAVPPADREKWIADNAPNLDVVFSNPKLVATGWDLFGPGYNFPTIIWYQLPLNPYTVRQASARHWRIGQTEVCRTYFMHYAGTIQERIYKLVKDKIAAAEHGEDMAMDRGALALQLSWSLLGDE